MNTEDKQQFNSEQNQNTSQNIDSVTKNQVENKINEQEEDQSEDNYEEDWDDDQAEADEYENENGDLPKIDYTEYSREALVKRLKEIIENEEISNKKREIDIIKATFYKKHRAFNDEQKKEFIGKGGDPEEFKPEKDQLEIEIKELLKQYKDKKNQINKKIEEEKKKNLEKKNQVIEELKNLVNKKESLGQTFKEFRDLQRRWREIGPVPQNRVKDLWGTYHHHVEKFYDYVKINKELRDLDLKKNLKAKLDLCEKAEKLDEEKDIVYAFKTLQQLHDQWREIGPVPNEKKEEIWQRFKEATSVINKKHQNYFKELRKQQNANLEAKTKLCEKAEEIAEMEIDTHKDWNYYTKQILNLQKEWRTIGFAPKKHNNKIYRRFRKACDRFFAKKRVFYSQHKEWQENNLKKKEEFVKRAEELKDSTDWDNATKELIELQKEWKEIGPVPKRYSEDVWKRFRNACDQFFQRKKNTETTKDKDFDKNLKLKQDLIEEIKNYNPKEHSSEENLNKLKEFEERWAEIGFVPYKYKDKV
ncbi:MAG: DUF349 domain-containing protein, partial [Bacteroidia bacterium]